LTQGLNRQIRRMTGALGFEVERLQRVRIMQIALGQLPVGRWRNLTPPEVASLVNVPKPKQPAQQPHKARPQSQPSRPPQPTPHGRPGSRDTRANTGHSRRRSR
jgi:23S rRNA pseudouridine2604 synthase